MATPRPSSISVVQTPGRVEW